MIANKLLLCLCLFGWLISFMACSNSTKVQFENIPKAAIRKGGIDGAFWIHLISKKEALYKFQIYDDYNGELVLEANFTPKEGCTTLDNLAPTQLLEAIFEYDNHKTIIFTDIACQLILVPPVIDGRYKGTIEH